MVGIIQEWHALVVNCNMLASLLPTVSHFIVERNCSCVVTSKCYVHTAQLYFFLVYYIKGWNFQLDICQNDAQDIPQTFYLLMNKTRKSPTPQILVQLAQGREGVVRHDPVCTPEK